MKPVHVSLCRVNVTFDETNRFIECYGAECLETFICMNCQAQLVSGDSRDSKFPFESMYNVCALCEPNYTIEQADAEHGM